MRLLQPRPRRLVGVRVKVSLDVRSASDWRISGWERYCRALAGALVTNPEIALQSASVVSVARRLHSDRGIAARMLQADIAHYPTFPPIKALRRSSTLVTVHDLTWWSYPEMSSVLGRKYYRPMMEAAFSNCSIATVSNTVAQEIRERFDVETVHVIPPYVEPATYEHVGPLLRARPYFMCLGSVEPRKNLGRLLRAFSISGLSADFDLLVVGRVAWGELPDGAVHVTGASDEDVYALLKGAQALVAPSVYEGFGLPVIEAQSVGTQIGCSDIPVFREVTGGHATFFDPLSVESMADVLKTLAADTSSNNNGRRNVERYTRVAMSDAALSAYSTVFSATG